MTTKKSPFRFIAFTVKILFVLLLSACGGGGSSGSDNESEFEPSPVAQRISISVSSTELLYYGEEQEISLTLTYSDGSTEDVTSSAQWSVDPATVAKIESVDGSTYLHPLENGSATVTAYHLELTDSINVTVSPYIHAIETVQNAITFPKNTAMPFLRQAHARVQGADDFSILEDIIYTSSSPAIADFSGTPYSVIVHPERSPQFGHITPQAVGQTEVDLHYEGYDLGTRQVYIEDYYLLGSDQQRLYGAAWFDVFGTTFNEKGNIALLTGSSAGQFTVDLQVFNAESNSLEDKFNVLKDFELPAIRSALAKTYSGGTVTLFWITPSGAFSADIDTQTKQVSFVTLSETIENSYAPPNYLFKSDSGSLLACWLDTSIMATQCKPRSADGTWSHDIIELPQNIRSLSANDQGVVVLARVIDGADGQKLLETHRFDFDMLPVEVTVDQLPVSPDAGGAGSPAISPTGSIAVPVGYAPRRDEFDFNESGLQVAIHDATNGWSLEEVYAYGTTRVSAEIETTWSGERALVLVTNPLGNTTDTWMYADQSWSKQDSLRAIGFATPTLDYAPIATNNSWVLPVPGVDSFYLFCFDDAFGWSSLETFSPMAQWGNVSAHFSLGPSNLLALVWQEHAAFGTEDGGLTNNALTFFHPKYSDLSQCGSPGT